MDTTRANTAHPQAPQAAHDDLAVARRVLRTEASALEALADALDETLPLALDLLTLKDGGRVVVTGMGKSGHIGRKIAATLASTGTPAQYVHPGEASHGDLGMITAHDAVLALSNSGETAELSDVIEYCRRFKIPLVAVTSRDESALGKDSDLTILLPPAEEACPHRLTPTTSTTMMLALGDALAIALLERRGFSAIDFKTFHPGGKLGRRLLHVTDLMHTGDRLPLIAIDRLMSQALVIMSEKSFGCVGVINDNGRLAGIVTDGDLRRHMQPGLTERAVKDVMTANPLTVPSTMVASEALAIMNNHGVTTLFVVDGDRGPSGILHVHDLLRAGVA